MKAFLAERNKRVANSNGLYYSATAQLVALEPVCQQLLDTLLANSVLVGLFAFELRGDIFGLGRALLMVPKLIEGFFDFLLRSAFHILQYSFPKRKPHGGLFSIRALIRGFDISLEGGMVHDFEADHLIARHIIDGRRCVSGSFALQHWAHNRGQCTYGIVESDKAFTSQDHRIAHWLPRKPSPDLASLGTRLAEGFDGADVNPANVIGPSHVALVVGLADKRRLLGQHFAHKALCRRDEGRRSIAGPCSRERDAAGHRVTP